jgi:hypothetical protein
MSVSSRSSSTVIRSSEAIKITRPVTSRMGRATSPCLQSCLDAPPIFLGQWIVVQENRPNTIVHAMTKDAKAAAAVIQDSLLLALKGQFSRSPLTSLHFNMDMLCSTHSCSSHCNAESQNSHGNEVHTNYPSKLPCAAGCCAAGPEVPLDCCSEISSPVGFPEE